jgi:ABC-type antimicrobial peptide transport system permease subunit
MAQLLPDLPRERVQALPDLLASRLRPWKVGGGLFMAAGGLALLVAAIGLYATTAFGVRLREHEFGIRRAVGATPRHLLLLAMRQTVAYAAGGIALGTVLGQWGARFVDPLLFRGVSARDPTVYLLAAIVLLATCLTATTFPARAAARVDPRLSLQAE